MPRRPDERPRVLGPYWSEAKKYWRITRVEPGGPPGQSRRRDSYFGTRDEAEEYRQLKLSSYERLRGTTFGGALEAYEKYLKEKGNKDVSIQETVRRLKLFFPEHGMKLPKLTQEKAEAIYRVFAARTYLVGPPKARREKPVSVDFHRNVLAQAKTFLRWCAAKGWMQGNPLELVKGIGRRRAGKPQLTGDEARAWWASALGLAAAGDEGALGCAMLLSMALRQGDVVNRLVRDLDLGGAQLRIEGGKTAKSNRPRRVPAELQPLLLKVAGNRPTLEPLFKVELDDGQLGFHTKSWLRAAARRVAKKAGVPYVCPHGLKGTAGTLAIEAGALADQVADYLSHEQKSTTERHYLASGAVEAQEQGRMLQVLKGGKG
jgi:integrase